MKNLILLTVFVVPIISISQCGDTIPPTASNPANVYVVNIGDVPAADPLAVIDEMDNSGVPPVVAHVGDVSNGLTCPEIITRTYSVTDTCFNQITVSHEIHVAGVDTSVLVNQGNMFAVMSNANYQWVDCDSNYAILAGETNQNFYPTYVGNFAVIVDNMGCIDTSACYSNGPLSLEEYDLIKVNIFPIPAKNQLHLEFELLDEFEVFIYDLTGKLILKDRFKEKQRTLDISNFLPGTYLINIKSDLGIKNDRIIIE